MIVTHSVVYNTPSHRRHLVEHWTKEGYEIVSDDGRTIVFEKHQEMPSIGRGDYL